MVVREFPTQVNGIVGDKYETLLFYCALRLARENLFTAFFHNQMRPKG